MRFNVLKYNLWWRTVSASQLVKKSCPIHLNHIQLRAVISTTLNDEEAIKPVHLLALKHLNKTAVEDVSGCHSYEDVLFRTLKLANLIKESLGGKTGERIGFLCPNDVTYVQAQWACWASGNIAVPLSPLHPPSLLSYYLEDCEASLLITTRKHSTLLKDESIKLSSIILDESWSTMKSSSSEVEQLFAEKHVQKDFHQGSGAMILFTSGTTGKPKGVLLSHQNLNTQVRMLLKVWKWRASDVIVNALPLHHTHGVINALLCPLYVGARCILMPKFDADQIWNRFLNSNEGDQPTIFMGVPTMYTKLLAEYDQKFTTLFKREYVKAVCSSKIRVMISGSASLPEPVWHRWHHVTGHRIVERYGMTEIGSVLSIPLDGERRPGYVGVPSPGVRMRIVQFQPSPRGTKGPYEILADFDARSLKTDRIPDGTTGELLIKGPNVFQCYWKRPEATEKDLTTDGWFRTGDVVSFSGGYVKILGRSSADIIKSGGYKISALEIETHLLGHPQIQDCTVIGVPDHTWGQKVGAALVLSDQNSQIDLKALKEWCRQRMAPYMVPSEWRIYPQLPRNALGKVNKVEFVKIFTRTK